MFAPSLVDINQAIDFIHSKWAAHYAPSEPFEFHSSLLVDLDHPKVADSCWSTVTPLPFSQQLSFSFNMKTFNDISALID
jgi:hypothetical protein